MTITSSISKGTGASTALAIPSALLAATLPVTPTEAAGMTTDAPTGPLSAPLWAAVLPAAALKPPTNITGVVAVLTATWPLPLNPLEEAQGYKRLIDEFNYDQEKVSKFIGKSRSYITNSLRLLSLPQKIIEMIENRLITSGHAKILVGLENAEFVANKIIEKKLSVRQAESFVKIFKKNRNKNTKFKDANIADLEKNISEKIGLNVQIKNDRRNKGSITFFHKEIDQLNKIIEIIKLHY